MEFKAVEKIQNKLKQLYTEREAAETTINADNEKLRSELETAEKEMNLCTDKRDFDGYMRAKEKQSFIKSQLDMNAAKKDKLWNQPYITDEEYEKLRTDLLTETEAFNTDCIEEIRKTAHKFISMTKTVREAESLINDAYISLQRDLYHWENIKKKCGGQLPKDLALYPVEKVNFKGIENAFEVLPTSMFYETTTGEKFQYQKNLPEHGYFTESRYKRAKYI